MAAVDATRDDAGILEELDEGAGLLRLATAGSVDDGKSTLIGRLLYDSKAILADQLEHVEEASRRASPSTSPTATSRPPGASSSSPTRRVTCSTRATWSRAPRPPTWPWCSSTPATG
jgi:hypothetical protein